MKKSINKILFLILVVLNITSCAPEEFTDAKAKKSIHALRQFCIDNPASCNEVQESIKDIQKWADKQDYGTFKDPRDGEKYKTIFMRDGRTWMAENLRFQGENLNGNIWYPNGNSKNRKEYGALFNYKSANIACPNGWHLPTEDEWWNLVKEYGGAKTKRGEPRDDNTNGEKAFWQLKENGKTKFNAEFAGVRARSFRKWSFSGFGNAVYYWTSSNIDNEDAYAFSFEGNTLSYITRITVDKTFGYSCRCIKDE